MITYTIKDISEILQLNYKYTLELLEKKELECIEIKDKIRITENQLKRFIEEKENNNESINRVLERERESFESKQTIGDLVNDMYGNDE